MVEEINNEAIKERLKELKRKKLELLKQQERYQIDNRVEFFNNPNRPLIDGKYLRANPKQQLILDAWNSDQYKTYVYVGGNRCISGDTEIYDPIKKESIPIEKIDSNFHVLAWDGCKLIPAFAFAPFPKGHDTMYRVELESGDSFEASGEHRVLTPSGFRAISELQQGFSLVLPASSSDTYQLTHVSNAPSFWKTTEGSQSGCPAYFGFYGEQPRFVLGNVQGAVPSQGDVQEHISACGECQPFSHLGGVRSTQEHIRQRQLPGHHPTQDDLLQNEARCAETLYRSSCRCATHADSCNLSALQPMNVFSHHVQPTGESALPAKHASCTCHNHDLTFSKSSYYAETTVKSITKIGEKVKWDCHVPVYNNYYAGGVIHANSGKTTLGCILTICTMLGFWPWNNERLHFPHRNPRKVRIVGGEWETRIKQVIIPELEKWWPKRIPVDIKTNNVGAKAFWTNKLDGSTLNILSNHQDPMAHEGDHFDLVYYDEPVKKPIYIANARGLVDRAGKEIFCMTLLEEAWIDREIVNKRLPNGRPDPKVFKVETQSTDNVGYGITQNGLDDFAGKLDKDDYDARILGIPKYKAGLVYPQYKREIHLKPRFRVPLDWPVDIAIDTHPRKPHSVLFMATSPRGFKYCIHEIREHGDGKSIAESVVRLVQWGVYRVNKVIIDPLSKGDSNETDTTFEKASDVFARHGMYLETASKNKDAGILSVKEYLKSENNEASLFFFDDLVYTIKEIEGLMWEVDPNSEKEKAQKVDDDMMEDLYRLILLGTEYTRAVEAEEDEVPVVSGVNKVTGY